MKICIVGSGYVGLVSGACFAETGHEVTCIDIDKKKIKDLENGITSIYEPGLEEIIKRNSSEQRLFFSTDLENAVKNNLFIFIAVGTPPYEDGSADLTHVLNVATKIGKYINGYKIIVTKSTVPVGTTQLVKNTIKKELIKNNISHHNFDVVNNPEFLKEGNAIDDFLRPDRIIIGVENSHSGEQMKELYSPFVRNGHPIHILDIKNSELTKYAANAMLAVRISFMNELSLLCDKLGADIEEIRKGIGSDSRIGMPFLYAGLGYGGSCFPKDIQALLKTMQEQGLTGSILNAVESVNKTQRQYFINRILQHHNHDLKNKQVGIWGLSFKPKTDDMREAPSLDIIQAFLDAGAHCVCHCPEGMDNAKKLLPKKSVTMVNDIYAACEKSDLLILITEWPQFRNPNWERIAQIIRKKELWDGRNQYDPAQRRADGWDYHCIGRKGALI